MTVSFTSGELRLSGNVTNAEFQAAVGGGGLLRNTQNIYVLQANMRLLSGCNLSNFGNVIIDLNARNIIIDAGVADAIWRNVEFIESGPRTVDNRIVFPSGAWSASGGGFLHNIAGNPGGADPRYLTLVSAGQLSGGVAVGASYFSEQEVNSLVFTESGRYEAVTLNKVTQLRVSARSILRNASKRSSMQEYGTLLSVGEASCAFVDGSTGSIRDFNGVLPTNKTVVNNFFGGGQPAHTLYLLGSARNFFPADGTISNRTNGLYIVFGGYRCYQFIGGEGARVSVYDSGSATNPQPSFFDLTQQHLLRSSAVLTLGSDEIAEFVVRSARLDNDVGWVRTAITGQRLVVAKYGKEYLHLDMSADPNLSTGSLTAPTPSLLSDDPLITEPSEATVRAYTTIDSAAELYDAAVVLKIDNPTRGSLANKLLTRSGSSVDLGALNLTINATASSAIALSGNTLTIKSSAFVGNIKTTGTVTLQNGATVAGSVADSTGVEIEITNLNPQGFTFDADYPATVLYRNVGASAWTRISGTSASSIKFKRPANTDTEISVRVPGYDWRTFTVNSGASGLSQSADLTAIRALDGTALFGVAGVPGQMDAIAYDGADQKIYISNTSTSELEIELQSAFLKFAQIIHNPNLIGLWTNQIVLNAARTGFEIPANNATTVFVSPDSTANIYLSFLVKHQASGLDARDRFVGNASGKVIMFATQVNQLSVAVPSAADNAAATKAAIEGSTIVAKRDDLNTVVNQIGAM